MLTCLFLALDSELFCLLCCSLCWGHALVCVFASKIDGLSLVCRHRVVSGSVKIVEIEIEVEIRMQPDRRVAQNLVEASIEPATVTVIGW